MGGQKFTEKSSHNGQKQSEQGSINGSIKGGNSQNNNIYANANNINPENPRSDEHSEQEGS